MPYIKELPNYDEWKLRDSDPPYRRRDRFDGDGEADRDDEKESEVGQ